MDRKKKPVNVKLLYVFAAVAVIGAVVAVYWAIGVRHIFG